MDDLKKDLSALQNVFSKMAALAGGSAFDLKSIKDYKVLIKALKTLKISEIKKLKLDGLSLALGTILGVRTAQFGDMIEALGKIKQAYDELHKNDPVTSLGVYIILKANHTGTMGGESGYEEVNYYDISTKKYLGGTTFKL